jgi:hypothetical protein
MNNLFEEELKKAYRSIKEGMADVDVDGDGMPDNSQDVSEIKKLSGLKRKKRKAKIKKIETDLKKLNTQSNGSEL